LIPELTIENLTGIVLEDLPYDAKQPVLGQIFQQTSVGADPETILRRFTRSNVQHPTYSNYSPPFWEILLDTVTAESPTGEG